MQLHHILYIYISLIEFAVIDFLSPLAGAWIPDETRDEGEGPSHRYGMSGRYTMICPYSCYVYIHSYPAPGDDSSGTPSDFADELMKGFETGDTGCY